MMRIRELKKICDEMPDDAIVLTPSHDHSYREVKAVASIALFDRSAGWTEDYGETTTPEAEFGKRLPALIIE